MTVLTIGAYYNKVPGSIGVSLDRGPITDEVMDVCKLTFPDGYADAIYTYDMIDHLKWADHEPAFRQMYRVLKKGGRIEIGTIEFSALAAEYVRGDNIKKKKMWPSIFGGQTFSGDSHLSAWEEWSLREMLERVGFTAVKRLEKPSYPWATNLFMEAHK